VLDPDEALDPPLAEGRITNDAAARWYEDPARLATASLLPPLDG
jgi:hypothetical protein